MFYSPVNALRNRFVRSSLQLLSREQRRSRHGGWLQAASDSLHLGGGHAEGHPAGPFPLGGGKLREENDFSMGETSLGRRWGYRRSPE